MKVEWDQIKAASHFQKHNIDVADAAIVLDDDLAITIREQTPGEERYVTLGTDILGCLLVVVYTWRQGCIRIISARKATTRERHRYES